MSIEDRNKILGEENQNLEFGEQAKNLARRQKALIVILTSLPLEGYHQRGRSAFFRGKSHPYQVAHISLQHMVKPFPTQLPEIEIRQSLEPDKYNFPSNLLVNTNILLNIRDIHTDPRTESEAQEYISSWQPFGLDDYSTAEGEFWTDLYFDEEGRFAKRVCIPKAFNNEAPSWAGPQKYFMPMIQRDFDMATQILDTLEVAAQKFK